MTTAVFFIGVLSITALFFGIGWWRSAKFIQRWCSTHDPFDGGVPITFDNWDDRVSITDLANFNLPAGDR